MMNYFENIDNKDLHADFIRYLSDFRAHLSNVTGLNHSSVFSMMIESSSTSYDIQGFLASHDKQMNRALMYMLIRDYDIEFGLHGLGSDAGAIYDHFEERESTFFDYDRVEQFITAHGLAGLCNTFPVSSESLRKELGEYMYEDIRHDESIDDDYYFEGSSVIDHALLRVRNFCLSPHRPVISHNYVTFKTNPATERMLDPDFIFLDHAEQELIISEFSEGLLGSIYNYDEDVSSNIIRKLLNSWPVELVRSKIISGSDPTDMILRIRPVIESFAKKAKIDKKSIQKKVDELLKITLIPFPEDYKSVFGQSTLDHCAIFPEKLSHNESQALFGIGFNSLAGEMGLAVNSVAILGEYEQYGDIDICEIVSRQAISISSVSNISRRSEVIDPKICSSVVKAMIEKVLDEDVQDEYTQNHRDSINSYKLIKFKELKIAIEHIKNDELSHAYNESLLCILLEYNCKDAANPGFHINDSQSKLDFIGMHKIHEKNINEAIISAGDFSQPDFSPYWSLMPNSSKKLMATQELGM